MKHANIAQSLLNETAKLSQVKIEACGLEFFKTRRKNPLLEGIEESDL